jgi:hypothetical protein
MVSDTLVVRQPCDDAGIGRPFGDLRQAWQELKFTGRECAVTA